MARAGTPDASSDLDDADGQQTTSTTLPVMLGIVTQAQRVQARLKSLVQLNIELAKVEGKRRAIALGIALGLAVLAVVLVLYAVGFLFAAAAVGIAEELPLWLSLLIVAIALLLFAAVAGLVAARFAKKVSPPSEAVEEAKRTVETVQTHA